MRGHSSRSDVRPDWETVCEVAAEGVMDPDELKTLLASKADQLRDLPDLARRHGVDEEVISVALARSREIAEDVSKVAGCTHAAP